MPRYFIIFLRKLTPSKRVFFLLTNYQFPDDQTSKLQPSTLRQTQGNAFIILLIALGTLLILGPDFVYLQDNFGYRINTIFKFYYQAWLLLSIASAYGTAVLLHRLRGAANGIFSVIFVIILIVGLTYPVLGALTRTNQFKPTFGFNLDDFDRLQRDNPDEAAATLWLKSAERFRGIVSDFQVSLRKCFARNTICPT